MKNYEGVWYLIDKNDKHNFFYKGNIPYPLPDIVEVLEQKEESIQFRVYNADDPKGKCVVWVLNNVYHMSYMLDRAYKYVGKDLPAWAEAALLI